MPRTFSPKKFSLIRLSFMINFVHLYYQWLGDPATCTNPHLLKSNFWNWPAFIIFFHWLSYPISKLKNHPINDLGWSLPANPLNSYEASPCLFCVLRTLAFPCNFWGRIKPYFVLFHQSFDCYCCLHVFHCRLYQDHSRIINLLPPPRCLLIFLVFVYLLILKVMSRWFF